MSDAGDIAERYRDILRRIDAACLRSGRDPRQVTVIGVTKTKPVEVIGAAREAGITEIGENYVQEMVAKHAEIGDTVHWHFIGHLQRNKVREIVPFTGMIHGVDSERLGAEIGRQAAALGQRMPVLLQVNTSGEESKFGVAPEDALYLGRALAAIPGIELRGLMTIAAFPDDPEEVRPMFRLLRDIREDLRAATGLPLPDLSMGMTGDFEIAVEEGATLVRIGTALFGGRG
ncbi:MAG: alanine racemase domain protein [Chlorobi bacterium]|jgi:pyridoxal phosphate enzyme (YggS family)|nr:alanine racemase domain protein [Chlorobiota bacterium]